MAGSAIEVALDNAQRIVFDQLQNVDISDYDDSRAYAKIACLAFAGYALAEMRDEYFEELPEWASDLEDAIFNESAAVVANTLAQACASLAKNELDCINERIPSIIDDLRENLVGDEED